MSDCSQLTDEQVAAYDQARPLKGAKYVCLAPYNNMYFNVRGMVSPCWLTLGGEAPHYPKQSIREIWFGEWFTKIRKDIAARQLSGACHVCDRNIKNGVHKSALARIYDLPAPLSEYPRGMEFELSDVCNLECIMCKGFLSSKIRRNRDNLPPFKSPYGSKFVEELVEFIPHLTDMRFNGGEPTLQKTCHDVWKKVVELNPGIRVSVTTNGTNLNDKLKKLFERGKFEFYISFDALDKANYERIRKNSSYDVVMRNMQWYSDYAQARGGSLCLLVNPMQVNWRELPHFVDFCSERNYSLGFNSVWRPFNLALWTMPSKELEAIHETLSKVEFTQKAQESRFFGNNSANYWNLVNGQIKTWAREQREREAAGRDYRTKESQKRGGRAEFFAALPSYLKDPAHRERFTEKVAQFEKRTSKVFTEEHFYQSLMKKPEETIRAMDTWDPVAATEWIYYVGDYY